MKLLPYYPFSPFSSDLNIFAVLFLIGVSIALIFAGRKVIKAIVFVVAGFGASLIASNVGFSFLGSSGAVLGGILGFIGGGLLAVLLLPLGIGFALAYFGYSFADSVLSIGAVSFVIAIILFIVGAILSGKILALVSAVLGGLILFNVAIVEGLQPILAIVLVAALTVAGYVMQTRMQSHLSPQAPRTAIG